MDASARAAELLADSSVRVEFLADLLMSVSLSGRASYVHTGEFDLETSNAHLMDHNELVHRIASLLGSYATDAREAFPPAAFVDFILDVFNMHSKDPANGRWILEEAVAEFERSHAR